MTAAWLYLIASGIGAGLTATAWLRARRIRGFAPVWFFSGWLVGELPLHHIAWQALATLVFAAFGALEAWPGVLGLAISFASWAALVGIHVSALRAGRTAEAALAPLGLVPAPLPPRHGLRPFRMRRAGVERIADLEYGPVLPGDKGRRNRLDVFRPVAPGERRPVLLQVHGGGWMIGDKEQQGLPLLYEMASRGWVGVAINYRLSPQATFPDHVVDVKRAIAWIRREIAAHGGDPDFICITGGSAGGHLAALTALSPNDPLFQPGFEEVETSVAACVPYYGVYDFLDRRGIRGRQSMAPLLARHVLKCAPEQNPELWEAASPLSRVDAGAPPFLVVHGSHDSLVFVEEARLFVDALREKSREPVLYLEMPGAQHAFDIFHSPRSGQAMMASAAFLEHVHRSRREG